MAKGQRLPETTVPPIPLSVLILWIFGGAAFAAITYMFTPFTHNLDDIKVCFQYALAPIVWGFFAVALWCGHIRRVHPVVVFSLSAFMLVMLLATIFASFPWRAWHDLAYQMTIMTPFLVVVGTATNERRFRNMSLYYFLIGCGTILFGLFHYFGGVGYLFRALYPTGNPTSGYTALYTLLYTLRMNGDMLSTILNRDFYAAYLIMVVPMGVALTLYYPDLRAKIFFLLMFFLGCVCIILAFSKDSYMGLFLVLLVFLVLFAARRDWRAVPRPLWSVWIVGGTVIFLTALWVIRDRFANFEGTFNSSIMSRSVIWSGSWHVFCDVTRPLGKFLKFLFLGAGPGGFYLWFPHYRHPDYNLYQISHITIFSHNQYLDLTAEEGLLGFLTFMFFLGAVCWFVLREAWRKPHHHLNPCLIMLFASITGVSFQNIFSPAIRWTVAGFEYYYLLGLTVAGFHLALDEREVARIDSFYNFPPLFRKAVAGAFLVMTLGFMAVSVPYGLAYFNASKTNNDGLILLNDFGARCDQMATKPELAQDPNWRQQTRRLGLATAQELRRALQWQPDFITSYYKLAHVYSRLASSVADDRVESMKWWNMAKDTYDILASYAPDYSEIHLNYGILGRVFYATTRNPEYLATSLLEFHKAAKMCNRLNVQNYASETLGVAATTIVTSTPLQAESVAVLEGTLCQMNPVGKASESFDRRMVELRGLINSGKVQEAAQLEAEMFREMGVAVAERMPTLVNQEGSEGDDLVRRARVTVVDYYMSKRRYDRVLTPLESLVKEDPGNPSWLRSWTTAAVGAGQPKRCLELLSSVIERDPLNWAARDAAREVLELPGVEDYAASLKQSLALEAILKHMRNEMPELFDPQKGPSLRQRLGGVPTLAEAYYRVAFASEKTGQFKEAVDYYKQAIGEDPNGEWVQRSQHGINRILPRIAQATNPPQPAKP
jgi:tetratricopeptide (TPR) repeat protein